MKFIKKLLHFVNKPELHPPVSLSLKQSVIVLLKCLPLYFVFILICTILFIPLSFIDGIPEMPNLQLSDAWQIIILAPLLEELAFRLPLRNFFKNIFCDGYAGLCFCQNLYWHTTVNCLCNIDCNSSLYPKFRKPKRGCSRLFYFQVL